MIPTVPLSRAVFFFGKAHELTCIASIRFMKTRSNHFFPFPTLADIKPSGKTLMVRRSHVQIHEDACFYPSSLSHNMISKLSINSFFIWETRIYTPHNSNINDSFHANMISFLQYLKGKDISSTVELQTRNQSLSFWLDYQHCGANLKQGINAALLQIRSQSSNSSGITCQCTVRSADSMLEVIASTIVMHITSQSLYPTSRPQIGP